MAVDARELAGLLDGDVSDASDVLALDQDQPMPSGADEAAPSEPYADAEAAPEAADDAGEQPLDEEAWKRRESELAATHEQDLAKLRSTKDREVSGWQTVANTSEQKFAKTLGIVRQMLADIQNGKRDADPRDVLELENLLNRDQRGTLAQAQQQQATGDDWLRRQHAGHAAALEKFGKDPQGRPLPGFDPKDPQIAAAYQAFLANPNTQAAWDVYQHTLRDKREAALLNATRAAKQREQAAANRARGQARGPQQVARGGGGGPANKDAAWELAKSTHPTDLNARSVEYERLITQHQLTE